MTEFQEKSMAGLLRLENEHLQMLVMLTKCERAFASMGLSAATDDEKRAALAMCSEIRALRMKVEQ